MYRSNSERANQDYYEKERERQEAAERLEVDKAFPPEMEKTFEELLEGVPPNVRRRLERAKAVLEGKEIDPADRTAIVADTVDLLRQYLSGLNGTTADEVDYSLRRDLYSIKRSGQKWIPATYWTKHLTPWLGTDADLPEIRSRVKDVYVGAVKSTRSTWNALAKLVQSAFPDGSAYPEAIQTFRDQIRMVESERLRETEATETPEFLAIFPQEVQETILQNSFTIELTEGCSVRCTFCAFDAAGGVRDTMPFETVLWLLRRVNDKTNLYYATDPLDYRTTVNGRVRTYADVLDAFSVLKGASPYTSTAAPIKSMGVLRGVSDRIERISFSRMNERRMIREKFIERTEGGTYLPVDPDLAMRFWMPSANANFSRPEIFRLSEEPSQTARLVYSSGRGRARSHEDGHANGDAVADSIACRDGVAFSPKGMKNSVRMMTTDEYPNGLAEAKLTPANLENGADLVRRMSEDLKAGGGFKIDRLLPHVVVRFKDSLSRRQMEGGSPLLADAIGFVAFKTEGGQTKQITGLCKMDSVTGSIESIRLDHSSEEMAIAAK